MLRHILEEVVRAVGEDEPVVLRLDVAEAVLERGIAVQLVEIEVHFDRKQV